MNAGSHRAVLTDALAHVRMDGELGYWWFGERFTVREDPADTEEGRWAILTWRLSRRFYTDFYVRGRAVPASDPRLIPADLGRMDLLDALSRANAGRGATSPGWRVVGERGDAMIVEREGLALEVSRDDVRDGAITLPREMPHVSPGHYTALGERVPDPRGHIWRAYLNAAPRQATAVMSMVTREFNEADVPFTFKMLSDSSAYGRCDAAVLYVGLEDAADAERLLRAVVGRLDDLRSPVPAFTKRLADGLACAHDPGGGESFGEHRCRLLAEACVTAARSGRDTPAGRLDAVEIQFADEHINIDTPWRSA